MMLTAFAFVAACLMIATSLLMLANRARYVYFVVGPKTALMLAAAVGAFAYLVFMAR